MSNEFIKYPKIQELEEAPDILESGDLSVFEKLDGGNCQIRKINGKLICGSRAHFLTGKTLKRKWFWDFRKSVFSNSTLWNLDEEKILFGEWLELHTIQYSPAYTKQFYLIDIYDLNSYQFISYDVAQKYVREKGIEINTLRTLFTGKMSFEMAQEMSFQESGYYDGPMEGIVIKNYDTQCFTKFFHPQFRETNHVAKNPAEKYLTLRKFQKLALDIIDDAGLFSQIQSGKYDFRTVLLQKTQQEVKQFSISTGEIAEAVRRFTKNEEIWIQRKLKRE